MNEPERPEAFDVLMQLRRFHINWVDGGYEDQPCILMDEINTVCQAEEEHTSQRMINQRNREKFNAK